MLAKFSKLKRSEFSRSVMTLSSGTAIAQAIPILISPLLTRMYTPEQFATFGLFTALIGIFGIVSTGKYEFAIMLPEDHTEACSIASLCLIITFLFSLTVFIVILVFQDSIVSFFNNPDFGFWIYFLPLGISITGVYQVLNFLNNRERAYTLIAKSRIARSVATGVTNVLFGYFKSAYQALQSIGLIFGLLLGQVLEILILVRTQKDWKTRWRTTLDYSAIKTLARKYINFPKFDVPSELMVTASIQLPVLLFNKFFEKSAVGFYFHAHRVLSIPMSMLGSAVGQVLFRQLSAYRHEKEKFQTLVNQAYKNLILLAVIPYSVIGFFGQEIFTVVFGANWGQSGVYAQLIAPWLLFNFVGSPLTMIFSALEKQRYMFFYIGGVFLARAMSMLFGIIFFADTYHTVLLFGMSGMIFYFSLNFYLVCFLSGVPISEFLKNTFGWPLLIVLFFGGVRLFVNYLQ
jgi:O-antigen/teichoic acid export membrane protein